MRDEVRRARPGLLLCGLLLALATGCLGAVASLYPPAEDAPAELVWVVDHGWHTGLVMARSSIPRGLLPEQNDFPVARYLEVGWGDADFYRARDPGLALAIRAAIASRASVVHVVGLPMRPEQIFAARDVVEIRLSRPGFEALARFVDDGFDREGHRRAPRLGGRLHGASAFYPARGRYHLLNTCNTWIARALRAAGVPITPVYAMTAGNLMWQVKRLQASPRGRSSIGSRPPARRLPRSCRGRRGCRRRRVLPGPAAGRGAGAPAIRSRRSRRCERSGVSCGR
jgi:uncharacterized protein (TIGR02117 family)